jgi:hypothetical protein
MLFNPTDRRILFSFEGVSLITEFSSMLKDPEVFTVGGKDGKHLHVYGNPHEPNRAVSFRDKQKALIVAFSREEWQQLNS